MLRGRKVAAIVAGAVTALAGTGFGLALAKTKTGSAMHHKTGQAMHHKTGQAMHHAGAAMSHAPTEGASLTG